MEKSCYKSWAGRKKREKKEEGEDRRKGEGVGKKRIKEMWGETEELWEHSREMPGRSVKRKRFSNL